jgi:hypothetical protein
MDWIHVKGVTLTAERDRIELYFMDFSLGALGLV